MADYHLDKCLLPFYRLDLNLGTWIVETSMKAFGIRSRPALQSSIAVRNTFEAKQGAPASVAMQPPRYDRKIWLFLVQGAVVAVLFALFGWVAMQGESSGGDIGVWIIIIVLLPAALICEVLGLGKLDIFGPTTIPEPALWCAMIFVAYIYGLVLVGVTRSIVWSCKKLFQTLTGPRPSEIK